MRKVKKRKFAKFLSLSGQEKQLFIEAMVLQIWVGLLLKIIPFRCIIQLFANPQGSGLSAQVPGYNVPETRNIELEILSLLKAATERASKVSPWKNKCLVSSLAARCMLNRRKINSELSLGVARGVEGNVIAHAWLISGDFEVVEQKGDYMELYNF